MLGTSNVIINNSTTVSPHCQTSSFQVRSVKQLFGWNTIVTLDAVEVDFLADWYGQTRCLSNINVKQ